VLNITEDCDKLGRLKNFNLLPFFSTLFDNHYLDHFFNFPS